jgi:hypothetical protein
VDIGRDLFYNENTAHSGNLPGGDEARKGDYADEKRKETGRQNMAGGTGIRTAFAVVWLYEEGRASSFE